MPWDDILFQERPVKILKRVLTGKRIAHGYLFSGSRGVGKRQAAMLFMQALNCSVDSVNPCGQCLSCDKIARSMNPDESIHPDILHLAPGRWISKEGRKQSSRFIVVDAVRALCSGIYSAPLEATWRVVLVHDADTMKEQAQNAFLKTLEEPLERLRTLFLLLSSRPKWLLPTIHSRTQGIYFGDIPADALIRRLCDTSALEEKEARLIVSIANGQGDVALQYANMGLDERQDIFKARSRFLSAFEDATLQKSGNMQTFLTLLGSKRETVLESMDMLISWHRDVLLLMQGGSMDQVLNVDRADTLQNATRCTTAPLIIERVERLIDLRSQIETLFIRSDLALQSFILDCRATNKLS